MTVTNISWLKIASGNAEPRFSADTIQRFFLEADRANRLTTPDIDTCEKVAMQLEKVLSISTRPLLPVSAATRKYFRLGLMHLARDYDAKIALGAWPQSMAGWDGITASVREAVAPIVDAGGTGCTGRPLPRRGGHCTRRLAASWPRAESRRAGQPIDRFCGDRA